MRQIQALFTFNRGLVSPLGLARTDQKRVALSAQTMVNWTVRVLGAMMLRCGWGYLGSTASNAAARYIEFVFSTSDTALLEFTPLAMRVWINDALLTRPSVSTAITNGTFVGNITGWTDGSDSGGAAAFLTGNFLKLTGNGTARAIAYQQVSVASQDQGVEHGIHIVIARGPVTFQVGTSNSTDDVFGQTVLDAGSHSISITPSASSFYVQFQSAAIYQVLVSQCTVEAAGVVSVETPYTSSDLGNIRGGTLSQSADIVYLACDGFRQRKIERRGTRPNARSWSVAEYHTDDGPFMTENTGPTTLTGSAVTGDITLSSSVALFRSTHVGAIFSLTANQAQQTVNASAQNTFTSPSIKVTGVGAQRALLINITGTWVATVTLQQSIGVDGVWSDVSSYAANQTNLSFNDNLDNQIVYYRIGIKTGNYTSGTATCQINYLNGSQTGIVQITAFTSSTSVSARVLSALGSTSATSIWAEGYWSDFRGWPTSGSFHEGRLWWAGRNGVFGSVSDAFDSFDANFEGDAGPIVRTIGSGPVDTINWILSMQRLLLGAQGAEYSCRSTSLDEPLTPTNFNVNAASTQGSSSVQAVRIDSRGVYVQRGGTRVFELGIDPETYDYTSTHLTALCPEVGLPSIVRIAVQRQPDTRIHCVRSDGTVAVGLFDKIENVICWFEIETAGTIEDAVVLPASAGNADDQVYYVVNRTINGATVRYLEKWAQESECVGGTINKQADAFVLYQGAAAYTITGLSHLEGKSVVVWGDGKYQGTQTVSGGQITLTTPVANAVIGLAYTAQWQSAKLAIETSPAESMLNQQKRISHIGLVMRNVHAQGIQFGPDFSHLDDLPMVERGAPVDQTSVRTQYDEQELPFPETWDTDTRLCLQATAPKPVTVLAATVDLEIHN